MKIALRIIGRVDGKIYGFEDMYLVDFNFEARNTLGIMCVSTEPQDAKKFESVTEAGEYWKTVAKSRPVRLDGKPNRPLSAYTVEFCRIYE